MAVTVRIPSPLQRVTNNLAEVQAQGSTVAELIDNLEQQFPGIKERLCDESGRLRRYVNIYVADEMRKLGFQPDGDHFHRRRAHPSQ